MHIDDLLRKAFGLKASDVHITTGVQPIARINGKLVPLESGRLSSDDTLRFVKEIISEREFKILDKNGEVDCAYAIQGLSRFRVNAYKQRSSYSAALRIVADKVPSMQELGLPGVLRDLSKKQRGLILITGPTGSGKSTTLASMIDYMNQNINRHIITLEDPIEYLHRHGKSMINQRQIGEDSLTFSNGLRAALREDPDVILVGEMRDLDTISIAITAAETGHLVLSTLHTIGAAKTIDRVIDVFPPNQQQQIRIQFSSVIEAVISQQIIPRMDGRGRTVAFEVMVANTAIRNLIREGKTHQMQTIIQTGLKEEMKTMDNSLLELYRNGIISKDDLFRYCVDFEMILKEIVQYENVSF